jgi:hypothetical protein
LFVINSSYFFEEKLVFNDHVIYNLVGVIKHVTILGAVGKVPFGTWERSRVRALVLHISSYFSKSTFLAA